MYNEKIKLDFIKSYTNKPSVKATCLGVFKNFEKYENEKGSDLCTMSVDELQSIVSNMLGVRSSGHYTIMCTLKAYAKWCLENNIDGATDSMLHVTDDNLEKIKNKMVNSPLHLQKFLDALYYKEDEKTVDDTFRCFFWLAFGGCDQEDIIRVLDSDVDFDNMVVRLDEIKEYPIYRESLKAFKNCVNLTSFVYKHPNYTKDILRDRVPGHQLLRGIKGEANIAYIRAQVSERTRKANKAGRTQSTLSHYRVWLSGMFYRIYQFELAGFDPDFSELALKYVNYKKNKSESNIEYDSAKYRIAYKRALREYEADYIRWKAAFIK